MNLNNLSVKGLSQFTFALYQFRNKLLKLKVNDEINLLPTLPSKRGMILRSFRDRNSLWTTFFLEATSMRGAIPWTT